MCSPECLWLRTAKADIIAHLAYRSWDSKTSPLTTSTSDHQCLPCQELLLALLEGRGRVERVATTSLVPMLLITGQAHQLIETWLHMPQRRKGGPYLRRQYFIIFILLLLLFLCVHIWAHVCVCGVFVCIYVYVIFLCMCKHVYVCVQCLCVCMWLSPSTINARKWTQFLRHDKCFYLLSHFIGPRNLFNYNRKCVIVTNCSSFAEQTQLQNIIKADFCFFS